MKCQSCGLTQIQSITFTGRGLDIHHYYPNGIASPSKQNKTVTLCRKCHTKIPKGLDNIIFEWERQFCHNASPENQKAYQLGDRFALIDIKRE